MRAYRRAFEGCRCTSARMRPVMSARTRPVLLFLKKELSQKQLRFVATMVPERDQWFHAQWCSNATSAAISQKTLTTSCRKLCQRQLRFVTAMVLERDQCYPLSRYRFIISTFLFNCVFYYNGVMFSVLLLQIRKGCRCKLAANGPSIWALEGS